MSSPTRPELNWTAIIAFVTVFVVVVSATSGGTYALLSDQKSVPASLTIEPDVDTELADAASDACSTRRSSSPADTNLSILESTPITEQQGCTRITFLVSHSTFNIYTPENADPNNTVLMHHNGTDWQSLNTTSRFNSSAGTSGVYNFTAYADSVASIRIGVPNPSAPTSTQSTSVSTTTSNRSSDLSTESDDEDEDEVEVKYGEGPVVPGSVTDFRNAVEDPNRSVSKNDVTVVENTNDGVQITEFNDETVVINYSDGTEIEYDRNEPSDPDTKADPGKAAASGQNDDGDTAKSNNGDSSDDDGDTSKSNNNSSDGGSRGD